MLRHSLSDEQWALIQPLLPPEKPPIGRPSISHRRFFNALLWLVRTGAAWRDLPAEFGSWKTIATRFYRWRRNGTLFKTFKALQGQAETRGLLDWEMHGVDSTLIRAHQHAAGGKWWRWGDSNPRPLTCEMIPAPHTVPQKRPGNREKAHSHRTFQRACRSRSFHGFPSFSGRMMSVTMLVAALSDQASAEPVRLVGKMAWWQQIVGSWVCKVRIEPMAGQPARTWITIAKGSVAPGTVFHMTEIAPGLETDQYDGYSVTNRHWWESQADSFGYATVFQSLNNKVYVQISTPPSFEADTSKYRETYKLGADYRFYQVTERYVSGSWVPYDKSSCNKLPSTSPA